MGMIDVFAQARAGEPLVRTQLPDAGPLAPHEIEIAVRHSSVCHSDVHLLDGDWGEVARPLVPGHEIIGEVVARGSGVDDVAEGALVGLGWQAGSCGTCRACRTEREHLCTGGKLRTCMGRQGGFASRVRADARFCFPLPERLDPATAAPLLCAGLTVYSPLERLGVTKGTRVGVVGLGGLGHLAVRFASAKGAEVIAFDPDATKRDLARTLGASALLSSSGPLPKAALDVILVTTHAPLPWNEWMDVLDLEGALCLIGIPKGSIEVSPDPLLDGQKALTGSVVGSRKTMAAMLAFAAENAIAPITERLPFDAAPEAIDRVRAGRARMRIVLDL